MPLDFFGLSWQNVYIAADSVPNFMLINRDYNILKKNKGSRKQCALKSQKISNGIK